MLSPGPPRPSLAIGIAADALPFVFDPLFQADASLERGAGGLDLGLTVAKALAEVHEGTLTAASDGAGRGTTIKLRVPRVPEVVAHVVTEATSARHPAKVLIIEDNRDATSPSRWTRNGSASRWRPDRHPANIR